MEKAFFLDKDGVLNEDKALIGDYKNTELFPYAGEVIAYLRSRKYKVFIVSNQTMVARGLITEKELKAGFKKLDVIIKYQGKDINSAPELLRLLRSSQIGDEVSITYMRGKNTFTTTLQLVNSPPPR